MVEVLLGEAEGTWAPSEGGRRDYYGSRLTCEKGWRLLVVEYSDRELDPSPTVSALFDVDYGIVDFSKAIDGEMHDGTQLGGTELEVIGPKKLFVVELRQGLRASAGKPAH